MGRVSLLSNDREPFQQDGAWKVEGDPTEAALYPFAIKLGMANRAGRVSVYQRHTMRIGAQVYGDAPQSPQTASRCCPSRAVLPRTLPTRRMGVRGCVPMPRNVCQAARRAVRRSPRACRLLFRVVLGEFGFLFLQQVDSLREGQVVGHLAEVAVGFRGLDVQLLEE